jgi:hypothetical protein
MVSNEIAPDLPFSVHSNLIQELETSEGLDRYFSLLYYSRMRFIIQLLPLLVASSLPAHVISVFGPHRSGSLFEDDLSLRDPKNYSFNNACSHTAYFKTFFMEYLAAQNPGKLSLVHFFPGLVLTESFEDPSLPRVIRWTFKYGAPILKAFAVSADKVGERLLFNASERYPARLANGKSVVQKPGGIEVAESSDGVVGGGAYRVNSEGEQVATEKQYKKLREEGWLDKVVAHTLKVFEEIQAGRVFTG